MDEPLAEKITKTLSDGKVIQISEARLKQLQRNSSASGRMEKVNAQKGRPVSGN